MKTTLVTEQFFDSLQEIGMGKEGPTPPVYDRHGNPHWKFWVAPAARHAEPYWELWKSIHIDERTCELQITRMRICPQRIKI